MPGVCTGIVVDATPHVLVLGIAEGERHFTLSPRTQAWRGGRAEPSALRAGDRVVVRLRPGMRDVADKMWAGIGRVTGTIVERGQDSLLVDTGATRPRQAVVIPPRVARGIEVRFPRLAPGHLIDVIGLRRGDVLEALLPATSQPARRDGAAQRTPTLTAPGLGLGPGARRRPAQPGTRYRGWPSRGTGPRRGRTTAPWPIASLGPAPRPTAGPGTLSGSATWHEPDVPGDEEDGLAYPAIDPAAGCGEPSLAAPACSYLPYLAVGSMLAVRNECTGAARMLPITGCGAVARLFCDRCLACGISPRVRIADLALASFVGLGGEPEQGCFNATVTIGW